MTKARRFAGMSPAGCASTPQSGSRTTYKSSLPTSAAFLGVFALLACTSVYSIPRSTAALADLSLEQLADIVVTTVSRREERLAEAPASVFVISGNDIRRAGATTLPEALRLAPNLDVARVDGVRYAISTRGFNSVIANNLLVMIDGRTVYSPLFSGTFWEAQLVMMEDIDRIEVISGPGATIWGTNAVNGVINVITRAAAATQGTLVSVGAGNRQAGAAARFGGALTGDGHYRVYGQYRNQESTRLANGMDNHDGAGYRQSGFRADWSNATDSFTLQGDAYDADIDQTSASREVRGANLLGRWLRDLGAGNDLSVQLYYDRTTREDPRTLDEELSTWDVSLQHNLRQYVDHHITWGGGYRYAHDEIENHPSVGFGFFPADQTLVWSNLFVQDKIALREDIALTLGLKAEHNSYTGVEWLPNVRIAWSLDPQRMLWASFARAVRAPSRIDREYFAPQSPPFNFAGGPNFQSEVANVTALGYRSQPIPALSYSVTLFHSEYDQLRTVEMTPVGRQMGNRAEATINGVEAWGSYLVNPAWRLKAGLTWMDAERRLKPDSTHSGSLTSTLGSDPSHWWSLRSSLDITPHHQFDMSLRRVGARQDTAIPAYTAVDARFAWLPRADFEVSLSLQNIFDPGHLEWTGNVDHERSAYLQAVWRL